MMLGLRHSGLWAELKALRAKVRELEEAAEQRQFQLRELQAKQHQILSWRHLMVSWGNEMTRPRRGPEGGWEPIIPDLSLLRRTGLLREGPRVELCMNRIYAKGWSRLAQ